MLPYSGGVTERRSSFMAGMSLGALVVTTRPRVPLEGLRDGENVVYLDDASPETLERTLQELAGLAPARVEGIRTAARAWYQSFTSEEAVVRQIARIVE